MRRITPSENKNFPSHPSRGKRDQGTELNCHQVGRLLEIDVASVLADVQEIRPYMSWEDHTKEVGTSVDFRCGKVGLESKNWSPHYPRTITLVNREILSRYGDGDVKALVIPEGTYTAKALDRLASEIDWLCEIPNQIGMTTSSHHSRLRQWLLHLPTTLFSIVASQEQESPKSKLQRALERVSSQLQLLHSLIRRAIRRGKGRVTSRIHLLNPP